MGRQFCPFITNADTTKMKTKQHGKTNADSFSSLAVNRVDKIQSVNYQRNQSFVKTDTYVSIIVLVQKRKYRKLFSVIASVIHYHA